MNRYLCACVYVYISVCLCLCLYVCVCLSICVHWGQFLCDVGGAGRGGAVYVGLGRRSILSSDWTRLSEGQPLLVTGPQQCCFPSSGWHGGLCLTAMRTPLRDQRWRTDYNIFYLIICRWSLRLGKGWYLHSVVDGASVRVWLCVWMRSWMCVWMLWCSYYRAYASNLGSTFSSLHICFQATHVVWGGYASR